MKTTPNRHERWITAGLIALAIIFLSYARPQAGAEMLPRVAPSSSNQD